MLVSHVFFFNENKPLSVLRHFFLRRLCIHFQLYSALTYMIKKDLDWNEFVMHLTYKHYLRLEDNVRNKRNNLSK